MMRCMLLVATLISLSYHVQAVCVPGCVAGVCSPANVCLCATGFAGVACDTNIDDCAASPCEHGGTCRDGIDSYACDCPTGRSGSRCTINANDCASEPCQAGQTEQCVDGLGTYTCQCKRGWTGTHCTTPQTLPVRVSFRLDTTLAAINNVGVATFTTQLASDLSAALFGVDTDRFALVDDPTDEGTVFVLLDILAGSPLTAEELTVSLESQDTASVSLLRDDARTWSKLVVPASVQRGDARIPIVSIDVTGNYHPTLFEHVFDWFEVTRTVARPALDYTSAADPSAQGYLDFFQTQLANTDGTAEDATTLRCPSCISLPAAAATLAVVVNLGPQFPTPPPSTIYLSRSILLRIFNGEIESWDHTDIKAANPTLAASLPQASIALILPRVGDPVRKVVMETFAAMAETVVGVDWNPTVAMASTLGGSVEEATAEFPHTTGHADVAFYDAEGAIGTVAYSIGVVPTSHLSLSDVLRVDLQNRAGARVSPTVAATRSALWTSVAIAGGSTPSAVIDPPGASSYPMAMVTRVVLRTQDVQPDCDASEAARSMLEFLFAVGESADPTTDADVAVMRGAYVPMPNAAKEEALALLATVTCTIGASPMVASSTGMSGASSSSGMSMSSTGVDDMSSSSTGVAPDVITVNPGDLLTSGSSDDGLSTGEKTSLALGGTALALVLVFLLYWCCIRKAAPEDKEEDVRRDAERHETARAIRALEGKRDDSGSSGRDASRDAGRDASREQPPVFVPHETYMPSGKGAAPPTQEGEEEEEYDEEPLSPMNVHMHVADGEGQSTPTPPQDAEALGANAAPTWHIRYL